MKDKWKIDNGIRGPEKTVKKKRISQIDVSESDEFILVHTIFFCNFLKETICSFCSKKCVSASVTEWNGLYVKVVLYCKNCDTLIGENLESICGEPKNCRIYQWHPEFNFWFATHKSNEECNATDEGASGIMEVQTSVNI